MRPDLLIELDSGMLVTSHTAAGERFMMAGWGDGTFVGRSQVAWQLPTSLLDPVIYGAVMADLTVMVRKAKV